MLDLLEFWYRVNQRELAAAKGGTVAPEPGEQRWPKTHLAEQQAEGQFDALKTMMGGGSGGHATVSKIPENLKDMIRWAEAEKEKRGMT